MKCNVGFSFALVSLSLLSGCGGALAEAPEDAGSDAPWWGDADWAEDAGSYDADYSWDAWAGDLSADAALTCESTCVGTCFLSICVTTVASGLSQPNSIAVDDTNVYWTDSTTGNVMRAPVNGGASVVLATGQEDPQSVAVYGANVYWIAATGMAQPDYAILSVPTAGGAVVTLVGMTAETPSLAVGPSGLFWSENGVGLASGSGAVFSASLDGSDVATLANDTQVVGALAIDSSNVYWTTPGTYGASEAPKPTVDGGHGDTPVQLGYNFDGTVKAVSMAGGLVTTLAAHQPLPTTLAVQAGSVAYLTTASDEALTVVTGGLFVVPTDGSGSPRSLVENANQAVAVQMAGGKAYWTGSYGVSSIPVGGGEIDRAGYVDPTATFLAIGTRSIFWTDEGASSCSPTTGGCGSVGQGKIYSAPR